MNNFTFYNPTRIEFGKGTIAKLGKLIPSGSRIMLTYGGGSIKRNGVYDQVIKALEGYEIIEFGGIEANPQFETCKLGIALALKGDVDFLLAIGGGSVLDGTKFIAAGMKADSDDLWKLVTREVPIKDAVPLGCVLTLPATGSEMNPNFVISRRETKEKKGNASPKIFPVFSILDPETTMSLPGRQTANGVVDSFIHVMEQYLTVNINTPIQDRQAEGVLLTLIEEGPKVMKNPNDYEARANIMWSSTMALNGLIGAGVVHDWSSHVIGHQLTALYGVDHGRTLAIVLPGVMEHQREAKGERILQYARRVWGITAGTREEIINLAIERTVEFFESLGVSTTLKGNGCPEEAVSLVGKRFRGEGMKLGEHGAIDGKAVEEILSLRSGY
ncbi:MAG: iron-containing alcohol dehydrogenase [Spirochaetales bacterium]|nr:iron-containing alcohol dehydrogenase [Spirochaetales bacterium]